MNAFAYATAKESLIQFDFVAVNLGSILLLFESFNRMMCNRKALPDVGDPSKEDISPPILTHVSPQSLFAEMMRHRPKCPVRARLAAELAEIALDFLFWHELAHLQNGHLEYFRYNLKRTHLSEAFEDIQASDNKLILQTLEWDADCGAVDRTLGYAFMNRDRLMPQNGTLEPDLREMIETVYASPESITRFVQFATYTFFRLFAVEWAWQRQPEFAHPLPAYRMASTIFVLDAILQKRGDTLEYSPAAFHKASNMTIGLAEVAFSTLTGDQPDLVPLMSVLENPLLRVKYDGELDRTWKEIRTTLDLYKRGGTLAP